MAVSGSLTRGIVAAGIGVAAAGGYAWNEHAAFHRQGNVVILHDDQEGGSGASPLTVHDSPRIGVPMASPPAAAFEAPVPEPEMSGAEPPESAEALPQTVEAVPEIAMLSPGVVDSPPAPPRRALPPGVAVGPPVRTSAIPDKGFTREIVYFATDRERNERARSAKDMFTTRRGRLEYGVCEVSVPDTHERGEIEAKKWYQWQEDPRKHILILEPLRLLDQNAFVREVKGRVGKGSDRQVLVFIHGYNVPFESALQRTAQLAHDLEFPGAAICYSWPSGNGGNYATDWTNAEWTTPHCVEFLELVATRLGATKVDLVAHSMGSRVLTSSLREAAIRWGSLSDRPLFHQVVLAAPDLDAEIFRTQIAP
ncbi:MAG TPA: alpha/beta hydrolase, partial [Planctomycetaceae bacterium]|nr:alpha/beta hydrolase [Planctomycetaceae bacterium]